MSLRRSPIVPPLLLLLALSAGHGAPLKAEQIATPWVSWAAVLRNRVDESGRVDFAGIQRDPAALDATVATIAATAPGSFVSRNDRLAYLINAYNALAMKHVIDRGIPVRLSLVGRLWFFKLTTVTLGGKATSLYDLENDIIRPIGEERVHFALNCMSVSCPRLPRTPFTGAALDQQLDAAARLFFSEPRNVAVEDARAEVRLSAIMDFYTSDFLQHAPSLIAYVNRYRSPPIPAGYRVRFMDYDWTINRQ